MHKTSFCNVTIQQPYLKTASSADQIIVEALDSIFFLKTLLVSQFDDQPNTPKIKQNSFVKKIKHVK